MKLSRLFQRTFELSLRAIRESGTRGNLGMPRHSAPRKQGVVLNLFVVILNSFIVILNLFQDLKSAPSRFRILNATLSSRNDRHIKTKSVFAKSVEFKLPKLKDFKKPTPAWTSALVGVLILVLAVNLVAFTPTQYASGAYTTSTTDADGNTHLGNNTVNDTYYYDTTQDSNQQTQQALGVDPNWRQGISRKSYALKFDGTDDFADTGEYDFGTTGDFTIESWVKPGSTQAQYANIFGNHSTAVTGFVLQQDNLTTNQYIFNYGNGSTWTSSSAFTLTADAWQHVAFVRSGHTLTTYVNGTANNTVAATSAMSNNSAYTVKLGRGYQQGTRYWAGTIDEFRISNNAQYKTAFTPSRRLVEDSATAGLWHLDEGTGTAFNDSSVYANNGTLGATTAAPTWVTGANAIMDGYDGSKGSQNQSGAGNISLSDRSSRSDDAAYEVRGTGSHSLKFDGGDEARLSTATGIRYQDLTQFTVEGWAYITSTSTQYIYDSRAVGSAGEGFYIITYSSGNINAYGQNSAQSSSGASGSISLNQWTHFAGVFDSTLGASSYVKLYINGVLANTTTYTPRSGATSSAPPAFGRALDGSNRFSGYLDEFRISNTLRYSSSFTPSRRLATDGYTQLLLHFDETSGQDITDSSGNGNNGFLGAANTSGTDDPTRSEGIYAASSTNTSSQNWAMPNYAYRKRVNVATTTALGAGHAVETTENRGTILNNKQTRPDGKDWRVMYQPSDTYRSLDFDGTSDYVAIPHSSSLSISTNITIEAWVKPDALTQEEGAGLICKGNGGGGESYCLDIVSNTYRFFKYTGATPAVVSNSTAIGSTDWTHVASTYNGSELKIYVNGVLGGTTSTTGSMSENTHSVSLGSRQAGGGAYDYNFDGKIDEVRISNSIRYTGNFTPNRTPFTPDTSTKGLWHLDEASGQIVVDSSSNGNNGTLGETSGSSTDDPTWLTGATADGVVSTTQEVPRFIPHGHALRFDGSNDYARTAYSSLFNPTTLTLAAWVKTSTTGVTQNIIDRDVVDTNRRQFQFRISAAGKLDFIPFFSGSPVTTNLGTSTLTDGTWHHVAATYDGNYIRLFVDGNQEFSVAETRTLDANTTDGLTFGAFSGDVTTNLFNGQIDDARFYSRSLSGSDIKQLYSNTLTSTNGLVGNWTFDDGTGTTAADTSGNALTATLYNGAANSPAANGTSDGPIWIINGGKVDSTNQTQFKVVAPVGASTTSKDYYLYYGSPNEQGSAQSYNSYGLLFDGTNDYVTVADADSLDPGNTNTGNGFTLSVWFKSGTSSAEFKPIVGKHSGGAGWGLYKGDSCQTGTTATTYCFFMGTGATSRAEKTATARADTNWHHIVVTVTPIGLSQQPDFTIYVDGADDTHGTPETGGDLGTINTANALLVAKDAADRYTNASVDDVRIYNRTLSATEVSALYSNAPTVSNTSLSAHWKLNDITAAGTSAADSAGSNTGTLTSFDFNASSGWIVNKNLKGVTTEPAQTILATEQESPIFFEWQTAGSTWPSDRTQSFQLGTGEQQLGSTGVYVAFNPSGVYSRHDYYRINSWAIENSPAAGIRGVKNAFPEKVNLIATAAGLDIIDAQTNKLWMRYALGTSTLLGATNAPQQVTAKNGRIYVASANGLIEIQLDLDDAHMWTVGGNSSYGGAIADRNDAATYAAAAGSAIIATNTSDASVTVISNKSYVAAATEDGISVIHNSTQFGANTTTGTILNYSKNTGNAYRRTVITSGGELYGLNTTGANFDRYNDVHSDSANQTISADASYNDSTTPALRNTTLNDLSVTEGTSTADNGASNTISIAHNLGVDVLQEHSTTASGTMKYYARPGTVGSSGWTADKFSNAAEFDGSNDYINVPDSTSLAPSNVMTFETWIKPSTTVAVTSQFASVLYKRIDGTVNSAASYGLSFQGTNFYCLQSATGAAWNTLISISTGTYFTAGTWTHIACVNDGTSAKLYINGTLAGTDASPASTLTNYAQPLMIGSGPVNGAEAYFNGMIDEVRVSASARYTANFTPSTTPFTDDGANTKGLWHLDETIGQNIYDTSTNANTATLGATSSIGSDDAKVISPVIAGDSDKATAVGAHNPTSGSSAVNFDGAGDYLLVADNSAHSFTTEDFTASAWVNLSTISGSANYFGIVDKWGTGGTETNKREWGLQFNDVTDKFQFTIANSCAGASTTRKESTTSLSASTWYHLVFVRDGTTGTLYLNGTADGTSAITGTIAECSMPLLIGITNSQATTASSFPGKIDDVRIYNKALNAGEISSLYTSRNEGAVLSDLVGWWKMNTMHYRDIGAGTVRPTIEDTSSNDNYARLMNGSTDSPTADGVTNGPTIAAGTVKNGKVLWAGTNGASADDGAMTAISLDTDKQITAYTSTGSGLPDLDITALSMAKGGLALVGTEVGAWNPGTAGIVVDDTASSPATAIAPVRSKSGTIRSKSGTVRVKGT